MSASFWEMSSTPRIAFGVGVLHELPALVAGDRILLVTSPGFTKRGLTEKLKGLLGKRLIGVMDRVTANPDIEQICGEAEQLRLLGVDALLPVGGGSAIDTAKALSVALAVPGPWSLKKHFDGNASLPDTSFVPIYAVATTAGTGAEVTPFGTIWDKQRSRKLSIAHPRVLPRVAILDPELTLNLPEDVTVSTGLDAISQGLESLWNLNSNSLSNAYALQSLRLSLPALPRLVAQPNDLNLRSDMLLASLLAGLAIAHTRTALAHSMSYPLTLHFGIPHGLACSFTLPVLLQFTSEADDGRLMSAVRALGYSSYEGLKSDLIDLLRSLRVGERLLVLLPDLGRMLSVADEMYLPERAGNLIRNASPQEISQILERSLGLLREMAAPSADT